MRRGLGLVIGLALAGLVWAEALPSDVDLVRYLDEVVLASEYGPQGGLVRRWPAGVVTWSLQGPDTAAWRPVVQATLADLDKAARSVVLAEVPANEASLQIWCGSQETWPRHRTLPGQVAGFTEVSLSSGRILRAWVLLTRSGFATSATRVAREELFQALGFLGDATEPDWSITSQDTWNPDYTALDVIWLLAVYDLLEPGSGRQAALTAVATVIQKLKRTRASSR